MTGPLENPSEPFEMLNVKAHMPSLKQAPDLNNNKKVLPYHCLPLLVLDSLNSGTILLCKLLT